MVRWPNSGRQDDFLLSDTGHAPPVGDTAFRSENSAIRQTYVFASVEQVVYAFPFIGANSDAPAEAGHLGIDPCCAANYVQDARGTEVLYSAVSAAVASVRSAAPNAPMSDGWRAGLDEDMRKRGRV